MVVERKQFKNIIKNLNDFETLIINVIKNYYNTLPDFLDENKTYYTFNLLYSVLNNRWSNFYTIDDEDSFKRHFINVLIQTLPTLHFKTIKLKNETLEKIDAEAIFTSTRTQQLQDPENNNIEVHSAFSESPETQGRDFLETTNVLEKNYNKTIDKRINVETTEDRVGALKNYNDVLFSGELLVWVNCKQITSLFTDRTQQEKENIEFEYL